MEAARRRSEGEAEEEGSQRTRSTEAASGWRRNEGESAIAGVWRFRVPGVCAMRKWMLKPLSSKRTDSREFGNF